MTENTKTLTFAILAILALAIAWIARPSDSVPTEIDDSGERFFEAFEPLDATAIEIVTYDDDLGAPEAFRVQETGGRWTIPSHDGYPADAQEQLVNAAAAVMDLIKGPKVSDRRADHELYGVVDPADAEAGAVGVGTRVTMTGEGGETLVDLIIGEADRDDALLHYVRMPLADRVYKAAVSTENLTTRFEDWIEDDLLRLEPTDVRRVLVDAYSIDEVNRRLIPGERLLLEYDEASEWSLGDLGESEELDTVVLADMRRAVDDLRIVDVVPKPDGLSRELRTQGDMQLDARAVSSLSGRGFYITEGRLVSNQGDVYVGLDSGVEYVLRFGEIALGAREGERLADETEGEEPEADGANRYLFLMAQFNPELVAEPEYETLPELPEIEGTEADVGADTGEGADAGADADAGEDEGADADEGADEGADADAADQDQAPDLREAIEMAREQIEARNAQKREEHEAAIEAARERVRELNDRFADWYFVIPNDVYEKIRLTRADVVRAKEAADVEGPAQP